MTEPHTSYLVTTVQHICPVMCVCHILFLSYTVVTVGLVPDATTGTPNYQIPESTSPFQFCAQITSNAVFAPASVTTVNLITQPVGAQGLYNNFDTNTHLYHNGEMIGNLLLTSEL